MAKINAVRKKQLMLLAGGLVFIVGLSLVGGYLAQGHAPVASSVADKPVTISTIIPGSTVNQKDVWMASESAKIADLNKKNADLMSALEGIRSGDVQIGKDKNNYPPAPPPPLSSPMPNYPPPALPPATSMVNSKNVNGSAAGLNYKPGMPSNGQVNNGINNVDANGQVIQNPSVDEGIFSLEIVNAEPVSAKNVRSKVAATDDSSGNEASTESNNTREMDDMTIGQYLPSGTFARVVLLSGLDAPTGGQAQTNPHPVLLKVMDPAQLPNKFKANLKECLITGNGYGDLSSERAYIRTDRLSCVDEDGKTIDVAFKGYIAGEDGKAGMRGRLISKQGRILANALLAGIGSGLGQAFQQSATTQSTNGFGGTTSQVNSGQEFQAGISSGVSKAMDQLAKYYIALAEKIYPVIEVDSGRVADVVITLGFSMERK